VTDADRLREAGLRVISGDNHQHLVCRRCGRVADADCAAGHTPCLEPLAAAGFAIDRAEVTFWGLCPHCRARQDVPGESADVPRESADVPGESAEVPGESADVPRESAAPGLRP